MPRSDWHSGHRIVRDTPVISRFDLLGGQCGSRRTTLRHGHTGFRAGDQIQLLYPYDHPTVFVDFGRHASRIRGKIDRAIIDDRSFLPKDTAAYGSRGHSHPIRRQCRPAKMASRTASKLGSCTDAINFRRGSRPILIFFLRHLAVFQVFETFQESYGGSKVLG